MLKAHNRSIANALGFTTLILLLGGCSLLQPPVQQIEVSTKPIEKPKLTLPRADELQSRDVKWTLLTPENFDEEVEKLIANGRPVVFFAITDQGYENLGLNLSDLRAFIMQQQSIINAYEVYYQAADDALEGAVEIE